MRIGINTRPSVAGGRPATLDDMIQQVTDIARDGFNYAAFAHIFGLDALTVIAVAGRVVPRIELMTAVLPIYLWHPVLMAQQALTTQAAVRGRLRLGIGLSHKPAVEQRWGLAFERPVDYMREYLAILQPLLGGEPVTYQGERLKAQTQLSIADTPAPGLILAALGQRMLRLAGEHADGTALWLVGPHTLASHITPIITEAAANAGRPAPRIIVGLPICVTSDPSAARERAARGLGFYGELPSYRAMLDREGAAGAADVMVVGSESDVDGQLARLEEAGATDFTASVIGSATEHQRTLEFLQSRMARRLNTQA
jgi:5,10-methylenetetrahydromethanopterin reductase